MLITALLALSLNSACVTPSASGPAVQVDRAAWVRTAHATVVQEGTSARLAVDLQAAFPAIAARRTVTVEGFASDGRLLFTKSVVACAGTNDARHHRTVKARASIVLPELANVAELRVHAGR